MIAARFFVQTWAQDNLESLVLSQSEERSKELLERVKFFYANLPMSDMRLALSTDTKHGLQFADTKGKISILSARMRDAAKGGTKQRVLLSEWCYYNKPREVLIEFMQPVAHAVGTEMIIESTGSRFGDEAHEYWKRCKAGRTPFRPVFLAWQEDPGCNYVFESERDRDYKLAQVFELEPRLKDRMIHHKLTAGQIYYASKVLFDQCDGDYEGTYLQYYPCTDEEAWRSHGVSFFGIENVNTLRRFSDEYQAEFFLFGVRSPLSQEFEKLEELDKVEKIDENESRPFIKVWKRPNAKDEYIISGDSAEGLEDGNFSSSFVISATTYEMMAEFHGRCRPDEHARVMASLGYLYNTAMVTPEVNSPGNVALFELQRIQYPNIYRWRVMDNAKPTESIKLGWQTNPSSRPYMLGIAKRLIEDLAQNRLRMVGTVKSRELLNEMATFAINSDTGKPEAINGANDDRVMAWSIAIFVALQESYGTKRDLLNFYKADTDIDQMNMNVVDNVAEINQIDPMDVIKRLKTPQYPRTWAGEDSYG